MIPVLLFPQFDPVLVQLGPLSIRWYALEYITSLVVGWRLVRRFVRLPPMVANELQVDDFLTWATLGVVLGGRLGDAVLPTGGVFRASGDDIGRLGGRHELPWRDAGGGGRDHRVLPGQCDSVAGVCRPDRDRGADRAGAGRVANFINGELWGRPAPLWLPWAMEFPRAPDCPSFPQICLPRPSQLYEALLEGVVLFAVMFVLSRRGRIRARFGLLTGVFLCGYAVARITGEYFREPDAFLGFLAFGATMGQVLSVPMLLAGISLIVRARVVEPAVR